MCGRFYVSEAELDDFAALIEGIEKDLLKPRTNRDGTGDIVPGDFAPVLVADPAAREMDGIGGLPVLPLSTGIRVYSWGFPAAQGKGRIINARAESVADKPLFRLPFTSYRCLVPARGFYEWSDAPESAESGVCGESGENEPLQMSMEGLFSSGFSITPKQGTGSTRKKQPRIRHRFSREDGQLLLMAGLYWQFRRSVTESLTAFTILTVNANPDVAPVHDRMPLILEPKGQAIWLGISKAEALLPLLVPSADGILHREVLPTG